MPRTGWDFWNWGDDIQKYVIIGSIAACTIVGALFLAKAKQ